MCEDSGGDSPIAMAKNAMGMALACEGYGAGFLGNGAMLGFAYNTIRENDRNAEFVKLIVEQAEIM